MNNWSKIGGFLGAIMVAFAIYGYWWPSFQNMEEIPPVLAMLNPHLFQKDVFVQDRLGFGPRYFYLHAIFSLITCGLSVPQSWFVLYIASFCSFVLAQFALASSLGRGWLGGGILAGLCLFAPQASLGAAYLFRPESLPFVLAMAFTSWGVVFVFREKWTAAYLFFGAASLLQLLIGVLPGVFFLPILLLDTRAKRRAKTALLSVASFGAFVALSILPMIALGKLETASLNSEEFVRIYALIRHPHHIVPSDFPTADWINWGGSLLAGVLGTSLLRNIKPAHRSWLYLLLASLPAYALLNYVFVEIVPSAWVAKLQLARITPFGRLMTFAVLAMASEEFLRSRNWLIAVNLLLLSLLQESVIPLLVFLACLKVPRLSRGFNAFNGAIGWLLAFAVLGLGVLRDPALSLAPHLKTPYLLKIAGMLVLLIPLAISHIPVAKMQRYAAVLAACACLYVSLSIGGWSRDPMAIWLKNRVPLSTVSYYNNFDATQVARRFGEIAPESSLILIPPSRFEFRFFSQRSVVFDFFTFPWSDSAIKAWQERFEEFVGPITRSRITSEHGPWQNLDKVYESLSSTRLVEIANRYKADYVLTQKEWHPELPGDLVLESNGWVIYKLPR